MTSRQNLNRLFTVAALSLLAMGLSARAGNLTRGGGSVSQGTAGTSVTQTTTAATTATAQTSQAAAMAQLAQVSLKRSTEALQALQAQQNAQSAARNLALTGPNNLGTITHPLINVPDGLVVNGLVPGVVGTDDANPATTGTYLPVTLNTNGTASVTIPANTAITLPPNSTASSQITVSGTGTVGTITTGGTITSITAGTAITAAPGSTISLSNGGTVSFAATSIVPATVATYTLPASWSGIGGLAQSVYSPVAGQTSGPTTVTITQTAQQALLTWQTFNIGKNTTLDFDQSLGGANVANWVAINKIADDIAPSQILGSIQAPGQVYVINQNGIIFGGSSQVNTGALVASSLPINDNLVNRGLLNNPDLQFLFSQLDITSGTQGPTPAFQPQENSPAPTGGLISQVDSSGNLSVVQPHSQDGDVVVQAGAQLSSPTTPEHVGGKVALIGPNVSNGGTISSPDGQVILAAGLQVAFAASTDPSLRGLDVSVGQVSDPSYDSGAVNFAGTATNNGEIDAMRADVMMTGQNVNQLGVINSSTSVALNGRIDLLANYGATVLVNSVNGFSGVTGLYSTASGAVTFGAGSLTQIQPELDSTDTVVGTTLALSSQMNFQGKTIYLGANSLVQAPSANIAFNAGTWLPDDTGYDFYNTTGQVYLDQGAVVDVSGSENVSASVTDNIISVQLRGTELANSPLQQNGALRGLTVQVDIRDTGTYNGVNWIGTPLGDVSGYVNLIAHTVGQLTTAGGTVNINAGDSVVMQSGSTVDVSGGWINYQGGNVQTTKVVSNGIVYDISQATPNLVYSGVYTGFTTTSQKWGITQNYADSIQTGAQFEAGYVQGGNGGSLSLTAPAMALDGTLLGNTVAGVQQTTPIAQLSKTYAGATFLPALTAISGVPTAGSLSLSFQTGNANTIYPSSSPTPPSITFQNGPSGQLAAAPFATDPTTGDTLPLRADRLATVVLSPDLVNLDGFGTLSVINSDGDITVPSNVSLTTSLGGSITLSAANMTIDGDLTAPGGSLLFSVYDFSPYTILPQGASTPLPDATRGDFTLGSTAALSVAGLVIDNAGNSGAGGTVPLVINGGTISIRSYNTDLMTGSTINASGGIVVSANGKQTFGTGGSITLTSGQDLDYSALLGGQLNLGATLEAYSGTVGGSLAVTAPLIQIGGNSLQNGDTVQSGNTLWLDQTKSDGRLIGPDFFSQGGFGSFTLNGLGEVLLDSQGNQKVDSSGNPEFMPAVLIAAGTVIHPVAQSWQALVGPTGLFLSTTTLPLPSQRTPVSLAFNANGVSDSQNNGILVIRGDFVMGTGASITTDPQTNSKKGVTIKGQTAAILGSIIVPGGTISVSGGSSFANSAGNILIEPTLDLGPSSYLSAQGAVELTANAFGYTTGTVLPGGNIIISGNIVAEKGATLDVSGTYGILDVQPGQAGQTTASVSTPLVPLREDSNGGSITLSGGQELFTDATLIGAAGGPTALGGSLTVSSGLYLPSTSSFETPLDPTLIVTQDGVSIPVPSYYPAGETPIGHPVVDAQGNGLPGLGYFAVDSFDNPTSGFASLTLAGTVQFEGPITLTASRSLTIANNGKKASGGIIYADSQVTLTAPYIALGQAFLGPENAQLQQQPLYLDSNSNAVSVPPVYGTGNLQVNASLIDLGNLSLQNIGQVSLTATQGDIRGDGTFEVAGDMTLTAGQIYPMTETTFTLAAYDHDGVNGTITIHGSGTRPLPLSAGGTLNIFASVITQGGVLRAPIGTINLGSGVISASPSDPVGGGMFDSTQDLTMTSGSITSVSAVDPTTGQALEIPYGININGVQWNDPAGNNITTAGNGPDAIPSKTVTVTAMNVTDQAGSSIDISGGGGIYSYQFVTGTGGTVDILNQANNSYAILPSSYSATANATTYSPSYANDGYSTQDSPVAVGQEIYLGASNGLKAGYYTLLPSLYALQPGAYLVTPKSGITPTGTAQMQADGSSIVPGYIVNGLNPTSSGQSLVSSFQVDSPSVVKGLAQYDIFSGTTFLAQSAASANAAIPRLSLDAGQLILAAQSTLSINGSVISNVPTGGQGSLVDIAAPSDILIAGSNADLSQVPSTTLVLNSSELSAFGADSLLIGGYRGATTTAGTAVTVTTSNLTVDNAGSGNALTGPDVILVSNDNLTLDANAQIDQGAGKLTSPAQTLVFGNSSVAGSGDGTLVRVSSDASASIVRLGVDSSAPASLMIGAGATINGTSLTIDSTNQSTLLSTALSGSAVNIDSGLISLVLNTSGPAPTPQGLVLSDATIQSLQASATTLSLLSYDSIDIYGSGSIGGSSSAQGAYPVASFALHAAAIRGDGGAVTINAQNILIDNSSQAIESGVGPTGMAGGSLVLNAATIQLGAAGQTAVNGVSIEGYDNVTFNASGGILLQSAGSTTTSTGTVIRGAFSLTTVGSAPTTGNLTLVTPLITGAIAANQTITAGGALTIETSTGTPSATVGGGLGASLDLVGQSITDNSDIVLSSGTLRLEATVGDLVVGNQGASMLDVSGTTKTFNDLSEYTSGGQITLASDNGSVSLASDSTVNLAAPSAGGKGGSLTVSAPKGTFTFAGSTLQGQGGTGGQGGTFSLDVGTLAGGAIQPLDTALGAGSFTQSIYIRDRTDANVSVDGVVRSGVYNLSVDQGSITVNGTIDASDVATTDANGNAILIGGTIDLNASGSVTLASGSLLTVAAQNFSDAGQGGSVTLDAGSEIGGTATVATQPRNPTTGDFAAGTAVVDIQSGSTIDLSVNALAALGDSTGVLHLRAPQTAGGTDVQINPIQGAILNASAVVVEGYKVYSPVGGLINSGLEGSASTSTASDGTIYGDALGFTANTNSILASLLGGAPTAAQSALFQVTPGAEIINTTGDLTLASTWDLSSFRFGPDNVAGDLTLRSAGNLVFSYSSGGSASLSDGFAGYDGASISTLWQAAIMSGPSWSYQLTAGADFSAADFNQVEPLGYLASNSLGGSVQIGLGSPALPTGRGGSTDAIVPQYFQVIRTGTGNITISAGGDVQFLDPLATIYTAGTQAAALANFILPNLSYRSTILGSNPNPVDQAAYSQSGGNVSISAQGDIGHFIMDSLGNLVSDSTQELPTSWLFRQGFIQNGQFAATHTGGPIAATSWWVQFNNFFEGVGALGGGNVTLSAGQDVSNVDAVVPTNARMSGTTPNASDLVELGGGDLLVQARNDISGGVYYVERGQGTLQAGDSIHSNPTRATLPKTALSALGQTPSDPTTWLPTTLFLGKGSFDVSSGGSLLLGPVANPFLLPQSLYNSFYNKTYFSTYAATDSVNVSSLTGSVTLKNNVVDTAGNYYEGPGSLASWYANVLLNTAGSYEYQPWLSLAENETTPFDPAFALLPPTLQAVSFSGDTDIVGSLTLSPSPVGTLTLVTAGSINGFQPNTVDNPVAVASSSNLIDWGSSTINLSDADPASIPSIASPLSFSSPASGFLGATWAGTNPSIFSTFASLFNETGVTNNVLQTKETLHTPGLLHANDPNPVRLYAHTGDISGITLYSGKFAQIVAGQDITDISLYIQNDNAANISLVQAGRDLIAYDQSSALRLDAQAPGNQFSGENASFPEGQTIGTPTEGDLQINGPGTLEVLAGRNFNLGVGTSNPGGTAVGLTSVGNQRDPYLPFGGADIVAAAGINGTPDYAAFEAQFLTPGTAESAIYLPNLGTLLGLTDASDAQVWTAFNQLPADRQDVLALDVFCLVLRDAGRDHNTGSGSDYTSGYDAIAALFPGDKWQGDISLTSREIKTENGGNISLLAPGGQLTVGFDVSGNQPVDQGILTVDGGNISIFTKNDVTVGTSRIFTLNGGNEIIWSSDGNIAAGASSKTVQPAPPTRVVVDPQSADVQTDLAGLATGGGIGVLETVVGAMASDVDLIAPVGTVNAGDAGIRASGNLNIAAAQVLNAGNIQVGGKSSGVPTTTAPNISGLAAASSAAGAANNAASNVASQQQNQTNPESTDLPSIITVEVIGYGGGEG